MLSAQPVGTVFKWINFPFQDDGEIKNRYFIYFGKTGFGVEPIMFHLFTTTTQLRHYHPFAGSRRNNGFFKFSANQYGFSSDCILDVEINLFSAASIQLNDHETEIMGCLSDSDLRHIYTLIYQTNRIPKMVKRDILHTLRNQGITGLKSI